MKNIQRTKDLAAFVVSEAARLGATDCSVTIGESSGGDFGVRLGEVEQLQGSNSRELRFRALVGKRSASAVTTDFKKRSITKFVRETIEMAKASEEDPSVGLPEAEHLAKVGDVDLGLYDPAIAKLADSRKIEMALTAEKSGREFDARITNSEGASVSARSGLTVHANSRGFLGGYEGTSVSVGAAMIASQGKEMQVNHWGHGSRQLAKLESPESIGQKAAQRALQMLGARKVKTQACPVVFDPQMAARLLGQFVGAAHGSHVYRGSSFLAKKLGQVVAVKDLVIIDDGMIPGAVGSRPFDSEGLPTNRRVIVGDGKLQCHLLDSYTCRRMANGWTPNSGETTNLFIQAGSTSPEDIIASVKNGLYLTSVSGPGFNRLTGDYSLGATGIWIEDGKLAYPVSQITIASNILDMFQNIEAIGNDLDMRSSTSAPTVKIGKMQISGS